MKVEAVHENTSDEYLSYEAETGCVEKLAERYQAYADRVKELPRLGEHALQVVAAANEVVQLRNNFAQACKTGAHASAAQLAKRIRSADDVLWEHLIALENTNEKPLEEVVFVKKTPAAKNSLTASHVPPPWRRGL